MNASKRGGEDRTFLPKWLPTFTEDVVCAKHRTIDMLLFQINACHTIMRT